MNNDQYLFGTIFSQYDDLRLTLSLLSTTLRKASLNSIYMNEGNRKLSSKEVRNYLTSNPKYPIGKFNFTIFDSDDVLLKDQLLSGEYIIKNNSEPIYYTFEYNSFTKLYSKDTRLFEGFMTEYIDERSGSNIIDFDYIIRINDEIFFDIMTTLNVYSKRNQCMEVNKNYARRQTLKEFNCVLSKINYPELYNILKAYVTINAQILGFLSFEEFDEFMNEYHHCNIKDINEIKNIPYYKYNIEYINELIDKIRTFLSDN